MENSKFILSEMDRKEQAGEKQAKVEREAKEKADTKRAEDAAAYAALLEVDPTAPDVPLMGDIPPAEVSKIRIQEARAKRERTQKITEDEDAERRREGEERRAERYLGLAEERAAADRTKEGPQGADLRAENTELDNIRGEIKSINDPFSGELALLRETQDLSASQVKRKEYLEGRLEKLEKRRDALEKRQEDREKSAPAPTASSSPTQDPNEAAARKAIEGLDPNKPEDAKKIKEILARYGYR